MRHVAMFLVESGVGERLLHGIGQYASTHGAWRFHRLNSEKPVEQNLERLGNVRLEGILTQLWDRATADTIRKYGVPAVNVGNAYDEPSFPTVRVDNRQAGRMAAEHFAERGIRNMVVFQLPNHFGFRMRSEGFVEKANETSKVKCFVLEPYVRAPKWSTDDELRYYARVLEALPRPMGIYALNDLHADTLLAATQQLGLRIPDEVAILGTDNTLQLCELTHPPLSSIDLNMEVIGYKAMQLLDGLLRGDAPPRRPILIPPKELVLRASTDFLALSDQVVMTALRFIRDHAAQAIDVEDVLDKVTISRRTLERKFRTHLGHSVQQEIQRVRLRKARKMLLQTKTSILDVALECGFASQSYFCQVFRSEEGMTPSAYRKQAQ